MNQPAEALAPPPAPLALLWLIDVRPSCKEHKAYVATERQIGEKFLRSLSGSKDQKTECFSCILLHYIFCCYWTENIKKLRGNWWVFWKNRHNYTKRKVTFWWIFQNTHQFFLDNLWTFFCESNDIVGKMLKPYIRLEGLKDRLCGFCVDTERLIYEQSYYNIYFDKVMVF